MRLERILSLSSVEAAPLLLGHHLERDETDGTTTVARIVEVEAYRDDDPASHSFRGPTTSNASVFAAAGTTYVYFTYGMHHCLNVAVGNEGEGQAVLFRAAEVLAGAELVAVRRHGRTPPLRGPGNLASGLAVDRTLDGVDLLDPISTLRLTPGTTPVPPAAIATGPRVGVRLAPDNLWRWWIRHHPAVSTYRRHPKAAPPIPLAPPPV